MDRQLFLQRYPEDQRPIAARLPFAAVKPPFEQVFAGPNGRMWLFKSDTALAPVRSFQVVDSTGVLFYVDVPSRGSAVGLAGNHVLMAEQFPGGVRLLQYVLPAEARPLGSFAVPVLGGAPRFLFGPRPPTLLMAVVPAPGDLAGQRRVARARRPIRTPAPPRRRSA